ncbi:MAG TPA: hypothetical protein VFO77_05205, partial [Actinoplanes sp.]|nr:hypothetical protein [Actinoplanes sp.]
NGRRHALLARLNATTGAVDQSFQVDAGVARTGQPLIWGMAVSPDGSTLVAVGNFTVVNGQARNQVVMVDLAGTPTVADWSTDRYVLPCASKTFPFYARDVDFSDDGSYFAIAADGSLREGAYCDTITRWETGARGSNLDATWVDQTGRDSVTAIEATDNVVYAAGHFRWLNNAHGLDTAGPGAVPRFGYGALDPINGMPMAWNPSRSGAPTGTVKWGPIVGEVWRGAAGLYTGFDNDGAGREYHGRMAYFPLAGGRTAAAMNAPSATSGYLYQRSGTGAYTKVAFDGSVGATSTVAQSNLAGAGASFIAGNRLYWAKTDGTLRVSNFSRTGTAGASWLGSSYNAWFNAGGLTGAFVLDGRMYYTVAGTDGLFYRYFEPDGHVIGSTRFAVESTGVAWGSARGMTWANGRIVFGGTDGRLRSVPFTGDEVDGAAATVLATPAAGISWNSPTLFYAAS